MPISRVCINEFTDDQKVQTDVRVHRCEIQQTRNGAAYLAFTFADRTGKIEAKRWSPSPAEIDETAQIRFARVNGVVQNFNNQRQFVVSCPIIDIGSPDDLAHYFEHSPVPVKELKNRLRQHIASVQDERLNALLQRVFIADSKMSKVFCEYPAALENHHAFRHGLLHHTLEVADMVAAMVEQQRRWGGKRVNHDMAVTGALLHDIGKVHEMRDNDFAYEFSDSGALLGHITQGAIHVARQVACLRRTMKFPIPLEEMLLHLISSHHGKGEWGSPKAPMTMEAVLIHMADKTSTDLFYIQEASAQAAPGKSIVKQRKLDSGFTGTGRFVFVGEMDIMEPFEQAVVEEPEAYPIPPEFLLPVLRLVSTNESATTLSLPLVGRIAAGQPILDSDCFEETLFVETGALRCGSAEHFLLRVQGDSMTGDGIKDNDLIVVRCQEQANFGDLVVAVLQDEGATVKRFAHKDGQIYLNPSNPSYDPIHVPDATQLKIHGRVVGIVRA